MSTNAHLQAIHKVLKDMRGSELKRGTVVRAQTTLGVVPADLDSIRRHAEALAAEADEWERGYHSRGRAYNRLHAELEAERKDSREEIEALHRQIDYACKYGERDTSMGQPQPHRPTIHERLEAERARVVELERENGQLRQLRWIEFMEQTEADVFADDGDLPAEEATR